MPLEFDATLKDLVRRRPGDFSDGFHLRGSGTPAVLNVDLSLVSAATDVVLAFGDPPSSLVDLNFQSSSDGTLVERLLLYNVLLHYRYGVPVHSLLVLLRPAADRPNLTGWLLYRGQGRRGRTDFRYEVIRLWQVPARRLLRAKLGILPLAVLGGYPKEFAPKRDCPVWSNIFNVARTRNYRRHRPTISLHRHSYFAGFAFLVRRYCGSLKEFVACVNRRDISTYSMKDGSKRYERHCCNSAKTVSVRPTKRSQRPSPGSPISTASSG